MGSIHEYSAERLNGTDEALSTYRGKVLLVVNVASKCRFTPQYEGLEALYQKHKEAGFEILGFPCNQFGAQEPGDAGEIENFCAVNYGVSFPLFSKVKVNGPSAHPVYKFMRNEKKGLGGTSSVKWNFTKFLVDREGKVIRRFGPQDTPAMIERHILGLLGE